MKKCTCCKMEKPLDQFSKRNRKLPNGKVKVEYLTQCKKCVNEKSKKYYRDKVENSINVVYRFLDKERNVLYVGKTQSLPRRVIRHISNSSHLPKECIDAIDKIEFMTTSSTVLMDIKEMYYINLYKPKYNFCYVKGETFIINDFLHDEWKDISLYKELPLDFGDVENISNIRQWRSIFVRKRNNSYIVYVEMEINGVKKQINKGSFKSKKKADKLAEKLRSQREYIRKAME